VPSSNFLNGHPVWNRPDLLPFLGSDPPAAVPSIVNAEALGLSIFQDHA
jgi:hydroxypyruvate reductase 1